MQFSELIGENIALQIPKLNRMVEVRLRGVEAGGLWVESQELTNDILQRAGTATAPSTIVGFLPYHQIDLALTLVGEPSLDERAFGV